MLRWIDTHNHLFVLSEEQQKKEVWEARRLGVVSSLVCAGGVDNLEDARRCAYEQDQAYACGIHGEIQISPADSRCAPSRHIVVTNNFFIFLFYNGLSC